MKNINKDMQKESPFIAALQVKDSKYHCPFTISCYCCDSHCCLKCLPIIHQVMKFPHEFQGNESSIDIFSFSYDPTFAFLQSHKNRCIGNNIIQQYGKHIHDDKCPKENNLLKNFKVLNILKSAFFGIPEYYFYNVLEEKAIELLIQCDQGDRIKSIKYYDKFSIDKKAFTFSCAQFWEEILIKEIEFHKVTDCVINLVTCLKCEEQIKSFELLSHIYKCKQSKKICNFCGLPNDRRHTCPLILYQKISDVLYSLLKEIDDSNLLGNEIKDLNKLFYISFCGRRSLPYLHFELFIKKIHSTIYTFLFFPFNSMVENILNLFNIAKEYQNLK